MRLGRGRIFNQTFRQGQGCKNCYTLYANRYKSEALPINRPTDRPTSKAVYHSYTIQYKSEIDKTNHLKQAHQAHSRVLRFMLPTYKTAHTLSPFFLSSLLFPLITFFPSFYPPFHSKIKYPRIFHHVILHT